MPIKRIKQKHSCIIRINKPCIITIHSLLSCIVGKLSVSLGDITIVSVIGGTTALEVPDKEMLLGLTEPAIAVILKTQ